MTDTTAELWSWVDAEPEHVADVPAGATVTAVLVARNADSWLADSLRSLARSRHAPEASSPSTTARTTPRRRSSMTRSAPPSASSSRATQHGASAKRSTRRSTSASRRSGSGCCMTTYGSPPMRCSSCSSRRPGRRRPTSSCRCSYVPDGVTTPPASRSSGSRSPTRGTVSWASNPARSGRASTILGPCWEGPPAAC